MEVSIAKILIKRKCRKIYKSVKVTIDSQDPMPIHLDGEALDSCNKMQFTIIPKAIRLLIPNKE